MVGGGGGDAAGAPAAGGGGMGGMMNIGLLVAMFAGLYFFFIRPENKRRDDHQKMIDALSKGAIVRTQGGIRGEIVGFEDAYVVLKIADKTKIRILRGHIGDIEPSKSESSDKSDEKKDSA